MRLLMKAGKRERRKLLKAAADKCILKINEVAKKAYEEGYQLDIASIQKGGFLVYKASINKAENKPLPLKKHGRPRRVAPAYE